MQTKPAPSHMKQRLKTIEDNLWSAEVALSDIRMAEMVKDALKLLDVVEQQVALARAALKRRKV